MPPEYWDWGHWFKQRPDNPGLVIGLDSPYLLRWYVIPRNRYLNVYLHKFLRSDDDRALHDHPWWFVSLMLKGGYWEHRDGRQPKWRDAGSVALRRANVLHRVELDTGFTRIDGCVVGRHNKPCWTLIVTGPKIREWGFKCPQGWRHWKEFTAKNGCGE